MHLRRLHQGTDASRHFSAASTHLMEWSTAAATVHGLFTGLLPIHLALHVYRHHLREGDRTRSCNAQLLCLDTAPSLTRTSVMLATLSTTSSYAPPKATRCTVELMEAYKRYPAVKVQQIRQPPWNACLHQSEHSDTLTTAAGIQEVDNASIFNT
jgi:hypothetical protein